MTSVQENGIRHIVGIEQTSRNFRIYAGCPRDLMRSPTSYFLSLFSIRITSIVTISTRTASVRLQVTLADVDAAEETWWGSLAVPQHGRSARRMGPIRTAELFFRVASGHDYQSLGLPNSSNHSSMFAKLVCCLCL